MVFAFGSPEGLRNTVWVLSVLSHGSLIPISPLVYVQTDTPINRGTAVRW